MSLLGIGLAFLMFWSIGGVGAYLALSSFSRLRQVRLPGHVGLSSVRTINNSGESIMALISVLLLLLGLLLVFEGFWFTYNVIFG